MRLSKRSFGLAAGRFQPENPERRPVPMRTAFVCSLSLALLTAAASNATAQTLAIVCHGTQRPGQIAELLLAATSAIMWV